MSIDPIRNLLELGHEISAIPLFRMPKDMKKVCFICLNTPIAFERKLGVEPLSYSVHMAKTMKKIGYSIYILQNPHSRNLMEYLAPFLEQTLEKLVFFYAGQQNHKMTPETHFQFDDGKIEAEKFIRFINEKKNPQNKVILISDFSHKGSVFDIYSFSNLSPGICSISTFPLNDKVINGNGIFVSRLCQCLLDDFGITFAQLSEKMKNSMKKFSQYVQIGSSSNEILIENFL